MMKNDIIYKIEFYYKSREQNRYKNITKYRIKHKILG